MCITKLRNTFFYRYCEFVPPLTYDDFGMHRRTKKADAHWKFICPSVYRAKNRSITNALTSSSISDLIFIRIELEIEESNWRMAYLYNCCFCTLTAFGKANEIWTTCTTLLVFLRSASLARRIRRCSLLNYKLRFLSKYIIFAFANLILRCLHKMAKLLNEYKRFVFAFLQEILFCA